MKSWKYFLVKILIYTSCIYFLYIIMSAFRAGVVWLCKFCQSLPSHWLCVCFLVWVGVYRYLHKSHYEFLLHQVSCMVWELEEFGCVGSPNQCPQRKDVLSMLGNRHIPRILASCGDLRSKKKDNIQRDLVKTSTYIFCHIPSVNLFHGCLIEVSNRR